MHNFDNLEVLKEKCTHVLTRTRKHTHEHTRAHNSNLEGQGTYFSQLSMCLFVFRQTGVHPDRTALTVRIMMGNRIIVVQVNDVVLYNMHARKRAQAHMHTRTHVFTLLYLLKYRFDELVTFPYCIERANDWNLDRSE